MGELTKAEHEMLQSFQGVLAVGDYDYVPAHYAVGGPVSKEHRATIKGLRLQGLLDIARGGQDDEGRVIGGTFYGITPAGRAALEPRDER